MKILRHYAFTLCLLVGIVLGGAGGLLFGEKALLVKPVGDLFLNLLFMVIVPLVFFSVSSWIAEM
ncbi:MAG: cation:dicarboxylate symporter family transporter [Plesiomonas shigelloides]